jgi:hypothetical protein
MQSTGSAFVPPYAYEAEPALGLRPIVQTGAGVK